MYDIVNFDVPSMKKYDIRHSGNQNVILNYFHMKYYILDIL